jgi:hypothetical protein
LVSIFFPSCLFRELFLALQGAFRIYTIDTQDALSSSHPDERHLDWEVELEFDLDL